VEVTSLICLQSCCCGVLLLVLVSFVPCLVVLTGICSFFACHSALVGSGVLVVSAFVAVSSFAVCIASAVTAEYALGIFVCVCAHPACSAECAGVAESAAVSCEFLC